METNYKDIVSLFVSKDILRPVLTKPFEINGKIYATNATILIRVDKDKYGFTIDAHDTPPNCESVIPAENINLLIDVNKKDFEQYKTEDETTEIGEDVECEACDGFGEVEWEFQHYTREFECPVCEGSCYKEKSKTVKTGNKTYDDFLIKIRDSYLNIHNFVILLTVKEMLNEPIYLIHQSESIKAVLFRVGIFEILIMPMMFSLYSEKDKVIDLKI